MATPYLLLTTIMRYFRQLCKDFLIEKMNLRMPGHRSRDPLDFALWVDNLKDEKEDSRFLVKTAVEFFPAGAFFARRDTTIF